MQIGTFVTKETGVIKESFLHIIPVIQIKSCIVTEILAMPWQQDRQLSNAIAE